jgi:transaldolase
MFRQCSANFGIMFDHVHKSKVSRIQQPGGFPARPGQSAVRIPSPDLQRRVRSVKTKTAFQPLGPGHCAGAAINQTTKGISVMKFFIDTANLNEIREAASLGILDGVTTNPSLIAKEGQVDFQEHILSICEILNWEGASVNAEVVATDYEGMLKEGRELAKIHPNVYVKLPMTKAGLQATHTLAREGLRINQTLIFSAPQALLSAKAGSTFVSPFIGRLDDIGHEGMGLIGEIREIFDNYGFNTQILAASIRHPLHVIEAARLGADIATMPLKVIEQMLKHPLTDIGLANFLKDWEKLKGA